MADVIYSVFGRQIIDKNLRDIVDNLTNRMNNNYEYKGNCDASKSINDYNTDNDLGIWRIASGSTVTDLPISRTANETIILLVDKARDGGYATLQTLIYTKQNIILKRIYDDSWTSWTKEVVTTTDNKIGNKFVEFNSNQELVETNYSHNTFLKASPTINNEGNFKKLTNNELKINHTNISDLNVFYGNYNVDYINSNTDKYKNIIYSVDNLNKYTLNNCTFLNYSIFVNSDGYIEMPDYTKASSANTTYFKLAIMCSIPYDGNNNDIISLFGGKLVVQKRGVNGLRLVITEGPNGNSLTISSFIPISDDIEQYVIAISGNTNSASVKLTVGKITDLQNKTISISSVQTDSTKTIHTPDTTSKGKLLSSNCNFYASAEKFSNAPMDTEINDTDLINSLLNNISVFNTDVVTYSYLSKQFNDIYAILENQSSTGDINVDNSTITIVDGKLSVGTIPQSSVNNLTTDLSNKAPKNSPTFTGTVTLPSTNPTNNTQAAHKKYVDNSFQAAKDYADSIAAANDAMVYKGTVGTGGTITSLPSTHSVGWTYKVATAGTYAGQTCEVGDMIICLTDGTTSNNSHWTVIQNNVSVMKAATSSSAGSSGLVPTPASGSQNKYLKGNGTWSTISQSEVTNLTTDLSNKAPKSSPTFTGTVTLPSTTPTSNYQAVHKKYVDDKIVSSLPNIKKNPNNTTGDIIETHLTIGIRKSGSTIGTNSFAQGKDVIASSSYSHAEGMFTEASNSYSHAEGIFSTASGSASHAEGYSTTASGSASHAEGLVTTALSNQHVQGHFNKEGVAGNDSGTVGDAFIIGNGTSSLAKSNAFRVAYNGSVYGAGAYNSTGADIAELYEWKSGQ